MSDEREMEAQWCDGWAKKWENEARSYGAIKRDASAEDFARHAANFAEHYRAIAALLRAPAVPEGWRLVPIFSGPFLDVEAEKDDDFLLNAGCGIATAMAQAMAKCWPAFQQWHDSWPKDARAWPDEPFIAAYLAALAAAPTPEADDGK